jgi:hypothetical protein
MASDYHYTGHVPYVERAARQADAPAAVPGAARQPALLAIDRAAGQLAEMRRASGQAAIDSPEGFRRAVADVLGYAHAARTELAVALTAADAILAEIDAPEPGSPPGSPPVERAEPTEVEPTEVETSEARPIEMMGFEVVPDAEAAPFAPGTGESDPDPGDGTDPGPTGRRHRRRRGEG